MQFNDIGEVNGYLESIPKFKDNGEKAARFALENIRAFCRAIGRPQEQFPAIHVAGTNGKGTTCRILDRIYEEAGYTVGLYTSPHLSVFNERFRINGLMMEDEELLAFFQEHGGLLEEIPLTYFELSTSIAFWYFARRGVDLAIIETGLGGRLDATNIITPLVSVITSIGLDHEDVLGEGLEAIAGEKAGIIKSGVPVVVGELPRAAMKVIRKQSEATGVSLYAAATLTPRFAGGSYTLETEGRIERYESDLRAPVNAYNIAVAWHVRRLLNEQYPVSPDAFRAALRSVDLQHSLPGHFEKLDPGLEWYFDGAHNLEAVKALKEAVATIKPCREAVLVFSMMKDKATPHVLNEFSEFKKMYYYTLKAERAAKLSQIQQHLSNVLPLPADLESRNTVLLGLQTELVIFAGSFYFYSTVRNWLSAIDLDH